MEYIMVKGETYSEALSKGLASLNLDETQVKVEIVEEKKGFLFTRGYFKLRITPMLTNQETNVETSAASAEDFMSNKSSIEDDYKEITKYLESESNTASKIASHQENLSIDSSLQINVSKDKLQVTILLTEPRGGKTLSVTEIMDSLNNNGIQYGIMQNKIEEIVQQGIFNKLITVAQGKAAIPGKNGQAIYNFDNESENRNAIIHEDGTIDYKNLNKIRNVNKDTLLLEIIPPSEGINGFDVYGNEIIAKRGKEVLIKKGKNVEGSEDGLKIYSTKDGEVYFANNTIYVDEVINIDGDINNETGNIRFTGKVNIKGNVKSGFKVEAEGDIEVWGVVEGAILNSNGNIILHRGVQGNSQANLYCLGDLTAKYIENATIRCNGSIKSDVILHSDIRAKGKITALGKKGLIAGGDIKVGQEIRANIIGSNMGTITNIEVGIDPEEKEYYEKTRTDLLDIERNLSNAKKAIELLDKMSKKQQLTKEKHELFLKSLNTYKVLKVKYETLTKESQALIEKFKDTNNGKVHAITATYPGVKITIGNCTKNIYDNLTNCTLYVKNAEITIGPYEK